MNRKFVPGLTVGNRFSIIYVLFPEFLNNKLGFGI